MVIALAVLIRHIDILINEVHIFFHAFLFFTLLEYMVKNIPGALICFSYEVLQIKQKEMVLKDYDNDDKKSATNQERLLTPQYSASLKICGVRGTLLLPLGFAFSFMYSLESSWPGSVMSMVVKGMFLLSRIITALCWFFLTCGKRQRVAVSEGEKTAHLRAFVYCQRTVGVTGLARKIQIYTIFRKLMTEIDRKYASVIPSFRSV